MVRTYLQRYRKIRQAEKDEVRELEGQLSPEWRWALRRAQIRATIALVIGGGAILVLAIALLIELIKHG